MPTHPAAPDHLPFFITAPGHTDALTVFMLIFLLVVVLAVGNLYFKLHALPEQMAHRTNHIQMQVVAVLALLALFTHNQFFWIGALLLALVKFPDFSSPINSIAQSLRTLAAGRAPAEVPVPPADGESPTGSPPPTASEPTAKPAPEADAVVPAARVEQLEAKA